MQSLYCRWWMHYEQLTRCVCWEQASDTDSWPRPEETRLNASQYLRYLRKIIFLHEGRTIILESMYFFLHSQSAKSVRGCGERWTRLVWACLQGGKWCWKGGNYTHLLPSKWSCTDILYCYYNTGSFWLWFLWRFHLWRSCQGSKSKSLSRLLRSGFVSVAVVTRLFWMEWIQLNEKLLKEQLKVAAFLKPAKT